MTSRVAVFTISMLLGLANAASAQQTLYSAPVRLDGTRLVCSVLNLSDENLTVTITEFNRSGIQSGNAIICGVGPSSDFDILEPGQICPRGGAVKDDPNPSDDGPNAPPDDIGFYYCEIVLEGTSKNQVGATAWVEEGGKPILLIPIE